MLLQLFHEGLCQKIELGTADFPDKTQLCDITPQEFVSKVWNYLSPVDQAYLNIYPDYSVAYTRRNFEISGVYKLNCGCKTMVSAYELKHEEGENND